MCLSSLSSSSFPQPLEAEIDGAEEPAPMYRLVLAGEAGAGKSSFLLRLTMNEFRGDIQTTLGGGGPHRPQVALLAPLPFGLERVCLLRPGVDFQMKSMLVDGERTSLQIWDTAGQERFRSIARSYFRKAHGVLLLYDVTSEHSFLSVRAWVDQVQVTVQNGSPDPTGRDRPPFQASSAPPRFSAGRHGGQGPHVHRRKQGGPAGAASGGQLHRRPAGGEAGQGGLRVQKRCRGDAF